MEQKKIKAKTPVFVIQEAEGYRIATFNIQKFSGKHNADRPKKDLSTIAKIIRDNKIDIVAIQEVFDYKAMEALVVELSYQFAHSGKVTTSGDLPRKTAKTAQLYRSETDYWEGRWAKPSTSYSDKVAEGYAFLWNKRRIKLVENYKKEVFEPVIADDGAGGSLVRPPFIGRFMPLKGRFEFRLINVHIAWQKPVGGNEEGEETLDGVNLRREELRLLLDQVIPKWEKKSYDVNRIHKHAKPLASYTFLMGDYNLNHPLSKTTTARMTDLTPYNVNKRRIVTVNTEKTTIAKPPKDMNKREQWRKSRDVDNFLANNYDHFSYNQAKLIDHNIKEPSVRVIPAYHYYRNHSNKEKPELTRYELYSEKISDHLPVILDVNIKKKRSG